VLVFIIRGKLLIRKKLRNLFVISEVPSGNRMRARKIS
jgi:hypothetical protein